MEFLLNASQMKQCDGDTIQKIGIPSMVLMERAALAVKEELFREKLDLSSVLVVCGSGNNGGDGLAVARLLDEAGVRVSVAFVGKEASMTEETRLQMKICRNCGIKPCSNFRDGEYTTIVDAVFGIGINRNIEGKYADLIRWINQTRHPWQLWISLPESAPIPERYWGRPCGLISPSPLLTGSWARFYTRERNTAGK